MASTEIKRPNYYEGQYLGAQDLAAAQEYQRQQDQRHRLAAHTWGIAVGLELEERPKPGGGGAVDVYLKPGYAVDGYGRAIVALEPYQLSEALLAQFTFDSALPEGRWVPVWLRYREAKTDPPKPGFAVCDNGDQAYRILETFRLIVGELPLASQQRDQISVAGKMEDAANEKIPDSSIPYQALPGVGDGSRWLIRLGSVRWLAPNPPATTVGQFVKSETPSELEKAREGRLYIGVVAESVLAPAGRLRIRDRKNPKPVFPETPELMGVEGSLRVDGISHFRDLLTSDSYVNIDSQNSNTGNPTPLNGLGGPALTFGLLSFEGIASKRTASGNQFGLDFYTKNEARLSITNGGNVGIATTTPAAKLEVVADWTGEEGALRISGDKPTVRFAGGAPANHESWIAHLGSNGPGNLEFFHRTGPAAWDRILSLTPIGRVGIGTSNPSKKLEVVGDVQVSGGNIFVNGHLIPVSVPVDVIAGERALNQVQSGFGIDSFQLTSRLASVSSADVIVALSHIRNLSVATGARWKVQKSAVFRDGASPNTFKFNIAFQVDDIDGQLLAYSFVAIFVP